MPGFQPYHLSNFYRGVWLVQLPDAIPDGALRRALNVRTDITHGTITTRPGMRLRTVPAEEQVKGGISYLSKLYGATEDWGYYQIGSELYHLLFSAETPGIWLTPIALATVGSVPLSDANYVDGKGGIWKFFVNDAVAVRHDGTNYRTMGMDAPAVPPLSATLFADRSVLIDAFNDAAPWTVIPPENLQTAPTTDSVIKQSGGAALTFTILKAGLGAITKAQTINLDTIPFGDDSVKVDDYIHLWIRVDRPEWLEYIQMDFDLQGTDFAENYYSVRIASLARLNQGRDVWTRLQVRKSEFARFGDTEGLDWASVRGVRLSFLVANAQEMDENGELTIHLDDLKLRGGTGIEGEMTYTITYRDSTTGGRGNPPFESGGEVAYTTPLMVDRRSVVLNLTNVAEGGAAHPGQGKIDTIQIWRRGGAFSSAILVDEIPDTQTEYTDNIADSTLVTAGFETLEVDNHMPPAAERTRILFGPDAAGYLFMLIDGHRLYFSKPFEADEFRAENWPEEQYMLISDGSQRAVGGICTDTETYVGTESQTYQIIGQGSETFLPTAIPNSHEWVGRWAVTAGDGSVFFVANDGIYEMRGLQQTKITEAIDPFFRGTAVSGQAGLSRSPAVRAGIRLQYYPDPQAATLVMTYANSFLTLKRSQATRQWECYFGSSQLTSWRSMYVDTEANLLFVGGADGEVYQAEDVSMQSDAGTAIQVAVRTKALNLGAMQLKKKFASVHIEGSTQNTPFSVQALYDRETVSEPLGTLQTQTTTEVEFFPTADPEARRSDLSVEITGESLRRITIVRISCAASMVPELYTYLDSDVVILDNIHHLKYVEFDVQHTTNITVSLSVDGVIRDVRSILLQPISVRQRVVRHYVPSGIKGYVYRISLQAAQPIELYAARIFLKPIGNDLTSGFKSIPLSFPALAGGGIGVGAPG